MRVVNCFTDHRRGARPLPAGLAAGLATLLLGVLLIAGPSLTLAAEDSASVRLDAGAGRLVLGAAVDYLLDPGRALRLQDVRQGEAAGHFQRFTGSEPGFGYRDDAIWLRSRVQVDAGGGGDWRLVIAQAFLLEVDVHLVGEDGQVLHILAQDAASPFHTRPLPSPQLVAPLHVEDGQVWHLFMRYRSAGHTGTPLYLERDQHFSARSLGHTAKAFLFQGMLLLLVLAGVATFLFSGSRAALLYAVYLGFGALFVFNRDGFGFQFLWPHWPAFNNIASLVLGAGLVIAGSLYTRVFLRSAERHPRLHRVLGANAWAALALGAFGLLGSLSLGKQWMVLLATASCALFLAAGVVAARSRWREVRFFVIGWAGVLTFSASLVAARHVFDLRIPGDLALDSMRAVIVFDALMMGLALVDRYVHLRAVQARMVEENLQIAERNLELSRRLERLEQRAHTATTLAESRGRALIDATHDLRQPLQALRMNIRRLLDGTARENDLGGNIDTAFGYLEGLVDTQLSAAGQPPDAPAEEPALPAARVLQHIAEMFSAEAAARGLGLRVVPASPLLAVDAMALTRVLSNLVGNAINYTERGRILVGCRRGAGHCRIEVHDTGPGMSAAEVERLMRRGERGASTGAGVAGHGLGLGIVADLCREAGLVLSCHSTPGRGTVFAVTVPRAGR